MALPAEIALSGGGVVSGGTSTRKRFLAGALITAGAAVAVVLAVLGSQGKLGGQKSKSSVKAHSSSSPVVSESFGGPSGSSSFNGNTGNGGMVPGLIDSKSPNTQNFTETNTGAVVIVPEAGAKSPSTDRTCYPSNFLELKDAVENQDCPLVVLNNGALGVYNIVEEIVIRRRVTIMGNPQLMPQLDASDAQRVFRVTASGWLEARFLRLVQSEGTYRDPLPLEFATSPRVIEIRGGTVLFEKGATGGIFTSCWFIDEPDTADGTARAIQRTLQQDTIRVYGGHVFMAGGEVDFIDCLFWEFEVLYPITNLVFIGGDILVLGGIVTVTGCTFLSTTFFSIENGAGLWIAVLAGALVMNFNIFMENNGLVNQNGAGDGFLVAGGVAILTGMGYMEWSGLLVMAGTGSITVAAGALILTGFSNFEGFGGGCEFGVGFEYAVGAGLFIKIGTTMFEWNGLNYVSILGEVSFVGTGAYISIGEVVEEYIGNNAEIGMGGSIYNGAGLIDLVGFTVIDVAGTAFMTILGEFIALDAGFLSWVGGAVVEVTALEYGSTVAGIGFVGAGAAVLAWMPIVEFYGIVKYKSEFWIQGTCEGDRFNPITYSEFLDAQGTGSGTGSGSGATPGTGSGSAPEVGTGSGAEPAEPGASSRRHDMRALSSAGSVPEVGSGSGAEGTGSGSLLLGGSGSGSEGTGTGLGEFEDVNAGTGSGTGAGSGTGSGAGSGTGSGPGTSAGPGTLPMPFFNYGGGGCKRVNGGLTGSGPNVRGGGSRTLTTFAYDPNVLTHPHRTLPSNIHRHTTSLFSAANKNDSKIKEENVVGLFAKGIHRYDGVEFIKDHLPDNVLENLEEAQKQVGKFRNKDAQAHKNEKPIFEFESNPFGYCGMCDVGGPTPNVEHADQCKFEKKCEKLADPPGYNAKALKNSDKETIDFPEHHIITGKLDFTTTKDSDFEHMDLQEALIHAIRTESADKQGTVYVNVWAGSPVDDVFTDFFRTRHRHLETEVHDKTIYTDFAIVAHKKDTAKIVSEWLTATESTPFEGHIKSFLEKRDIEVGTIEMSKNNNFFVPKYNSEDMLKNSAGKTLGTHSVMVVDPEKSAMPVTHLEYDKDYEIQLDYFLSDTKVTIELLKFQDSLTGQPQVIKVKSLTTDKNGKATVPYEFTNQVKPGMYYFKATTSTGAFGLSSPYKLSKKARVLRQIGTHMFM